MPATIIQCSKCHTLAKTTMNVTYEPNGIGELPSRTYEVILPKGWTSTGFPAYRYVCPSCAPANNQSSK